MCPNPFNLRSQGLQTCHPLPKRHTLSWDPFQQRHALIDLCSSTLTTRFSIIPRNLSSSLTWVRFTFVFGDSTAAHVSYPSSSPFGPLASAILFREYAARFSSARATPPENLTSSHSVSLPLKLRLGRLSQTQQPASQKWLLAQMAILEKARRDSPTFRTNNKLSQITSRNTIRNSSTNDHKTKSHAGKGLSIQPNRLLVKKPHGQVPKAGVVHV